MKKKPFAVLATLAMAATLFAPSAYAAPSAPLAPSASVDSEGVVSIQATTPVILVPGIGGSRLFGSYNYYNRDEIVWVDKAPERFALDFLVNDEDLVYNLTLKHNSTTDPTNVVSQNADAQIYTKYDNYGLNSIYHLDMDNWDMTEYFKTMINTMTAQGYVAGVNLFGLPYDWRLDYAAHFDTITSTINNAIAASGASKVNIVAHSQGGLLLKAYLLARPDMQAKINKFITMGTPFLGAAKAAKSTSQKLGGYNFDIPLLANETGFSIAKHAPAVYHLAPSYQYEQQMFARYGRSTVNSYISPAYVPTSPYYGYNTQLRNFAYDKWLFDYANTKHTQWDNTAPSVESYHLVSDTVSTETAYNYTYCSTCTPVNQLEIVMKAGDGTVPLISAEYPGGTGRKFFVHAGTAGTPVSHTDMVKDANVINKVLGVLNNNPDLAVPHIDGTVNRSADGVALKAYSFTASTAEFNADVKITNKATGTTKTYTLGLGEYNEGFGDSGGVIIRTAMVENNQFNVQYFVPANGSYDLELIPRNDAAITLYTYENDATTIKNRTSYGQLKHAAKSELKIEHRNGTAKVKQNGIEQGKK